MNLSLQVPLYYAGLATGSRVTLRAVDLSSHEGRAAPSPAPSAHMVGEDGAGPFGFIVKVSQPPRSYAAFTIQLA
eukprot:1573114-Prymnesium_polylepis.1